MQQSAMNTNKVDANNSLAKSHHLRLGKVTANDDSMSQGNRSTTTQGGGLANKIGQAVSRIVSQSMNQEVNEDEDDVNDLVGLLSELNAHHDLTVKLSNQSKIIKFLNEASDAAST